MGELVYAGGKQTGGNIEILVVKEVAQSYLTKLWNQDEFKKQEDANRFVCSFAEPVFHLYRFYHCNGHCCLLAINDPSKIWPAVTAIFIIACPCALLLSNTFTNGNIYGYSDATVFTCAVRKPLKILPNQPYCF